MILEYKKKILEFEGKLKKPGSEKGKNCLKLLFAIDKREYVEDIPPLLPIQMSEELAESKR